VASLAQLVASPTLRSRLGYLTRPSADPEIAEVALVEALDEVDRLRPHTLALLTRAASAQTSSYRFDVALRLARTGGVGGLVLAAPDAARITPTSAGIAGRSGIALLAAGQDDLAQLAVALAREIAGDADAALLRAHTALRAIAAHPADAGVERLIERAGAALGVPLRRTAKEPATGPRAPIAVEGRLDGWLVAPTRGGDLGLALDIVLQAAATAVAERLAATQHAAEIPIRSQADLLTELLSAPESGRPPLVARARELGLPVDGWHVAARLEFEEIAAMGPDAHQAQLDVARAALQAARGAGGTWHSARSGLAPLLVASFPEDPGPAAAATAAQTLEHVLAPLHARLAGTVIRCGVGTAHPGPAGLATSAAEARAAVAAARTAGTAHAVVPFDSAGLRRTLVEWYASDTAREAVATVLEPLVKLGGVRAERLIRTLHVYLDEQGSLSRTAAALSLHRNAVAYRVDKIFTLLDVDPDNPDDLLLLQLACRARELA
jgi:sugar diacid utilization regulator